ncbi:unnamed protein product, partial [Iphiclides podalirius]
MQSDMDVDSDGYSTVSENVTSDTSVHDDEEFNDASITRSINNSGSYDSETDSYSNDSIGQESEMDDSLSNSDMSESSCTGDETQENMTSTVNNSFETGYLTTMNTSVSSSDSSSDVAAEWDVTNSSQDDRGGTVEYSQRSSIPRASLDHGGVLHMLRGDPPRARGDDPAVHPPLPPGVHPALAPGAADLPQLP